MQQPRYKWCHKFPYFFLIYLFFLKRLLLFTHLLISGVPSSDSRKKRAFFTFFLPHHHLAPSQFTCPPPQKKGGELSHLTEVYYSVQYTSSTVNSVVQQVINCTYLLIVHHSTETKILCK